MMDVHWLEQTQADLPAENDWLSDSEAVRLDGMRFAKRRNDWRLGRWTAKRAVAAYLSLPGHPQALTNIEIRPAPSGAPEVFIGNGPSAVTISLSHRDGVAACALTLSTAELGCDLEVIEPRSDAFIADYFSGEERELIEKTPSTNRPVVLAILWSAKESALKALRTGLRLDTRSVKVTLVPPLRERDVVDRVDKDPAFLFRSADTLNSWQPLQVVYEGKQVFHGWWQNTGDLLRTMVASPPPAPPIFLEAPAGSAHAVSNSRRDLKVRTES
jgi:4'-phosphopantetheinyl transferase